MVETFFDTGSSLEPTATHHYGHDLISVHQNNGSTWQRHFYLYDGLGSVRALANEIGTVTDTYTYDAFGNLLHATGSTANPYRYTGERYDADLGMYYLRARYMNTETGRFWTMDRYEGLGSDPITLHKYLYANANPVMYLDPSGNCALGIVVNNLFESSKVGRAVHKHIQIDYEKNKIWERYTEKSIATLVNAYNSSGTKRMKAMPHTSLAKRVDLADITNRNDVVMIEIKPVAAADIGGLQLWYYISEFNHQIGADVARPGEESDYIPPKVFQIEGFTVYTNSPSGGILVYYVGCLPKHEIAAVGIMYGVLETVKSLSTLQTSARVGAFAGIQGRLSLGFATKGF